MSKSIYPSIYLSIYLRVQRICSPKYLNYVVNNREKFSLNLLHQKSFILFAKSKALKIHYKNQPPTYANLPSYKTSPPTHTYS